MLSFAPPLEVIGGHAVFRDTEDPDLYHVAPSAPRLVLDTNGKPAIALSRFLADGADGRALTGGFLSLTTEFWVPDDIQESIRLALSERLERQVRLSPILFDRGEVELVLLGESSTGEGDTGAFSVDIFGTMLPSLVGRNTTGIQVTLDHGAAAFLDTALGDPTLPALVIYQLALTGMQAAYRVEVHADWHRFYKSLEGRFQLNVYYVRADVETKIKESLQEADVTIETKVFDGDRAAEAAAAEKALLDWVTGTFFDPAYGQAPPAPASPTSSLVSDIKDNLLDVVDTLMPGASFKLKVVSEDETRRFSARIDRQMAREREVVFQASLGAVLHGFRVDPETGQKRPDWPALRDRIVTGVNIEAIPRREIVHSVLGRFASDGLAAVEIDLALTDSDSGDTLHENTENFRDPVARATWAVNLLHAPPTLLTRPYQMRARVHFDPASSFGPHATAESAWQPMRMTDLVVDPCTLGVYGLSTVQVGVEPGFPFVQFGRVEVELRRVEEDGSVSQFDIKFLTAETPIIPWTFRGYGAFADRFDYRVTYHRLAAEGGPISFDWTPSTARLLALPDPAPHRRQISFFLSLPFEGVLRAFLEVRYRDDENALLVEERIELRPADFIIDRSYAIADREKRDLAYRLTVFAPSTLGLVQRDWREMTDTRVVIDNRLFEERHIRFRALGLPTDALGLHSLEIIAEALTATGEIAHQHAISVPEDRGGTDLGGWSFPKNTPEIASVRVKADWRNTAGFPDNTDWHEVEGGLVLLRLPEGAFV